MDLAIQFILQLTPFANICAMNDYSDVLRYIVEYWEWDIDAYRTYLKYATVTMPFAFIQHYPHSPNLCTNSTYIVLCALVLLTMAEWNHFIYSGLTHEELRQRMYAMGHRTFAILAAIPRLGVIIIHSMEIVVIADSPVLALGLVVASMFPALIFPLVSSGTRRLRVWATNRWRQRHTPGRDRSETITTTTIGLSESNQTVPVQPLVDDIEASCRCHGHLHPSEERTGFDPVVDDSSRGASKASPPVRHSDEKRLLDLDRDGWTSWTSASTNQPGRDEALIRLRYSAIRSVVLVVIVNPFPVPSSWTSVNTMPDGVPVVCGVSVLPLLLHSSTTPLRFSDVTFSPIVATWGFKLWVFSMVLGNLRGGVVSPDCSLETGNFTARPIPTRARFQVRAPSSSPQKPPKYAHHKVSTVDVERCAIAVRRPSSQHLSPSTIGSQKFAVCSSRPQGWNTSWKDIHGRLVTLKVNGALLPSFGSGFEPVKKRIQNAPATLSGSPVFSDDFNSYVSFRLSTVSSIESISSKLTQEMENTEYLETLATASTQQVHRNRVAESLGESNDFPRQLRRADFALKKPRYRLPLHDRFLPPSRCGRAMSSQVMLINNPSSYSEGGHQSELTESCDGYSCIPAVARKLWDPTLESLVPEFATPLKNTANTRVRSCRCSCSAGSAQGHGDGTDGVERQVGFISSQQSSALADDERFVGRFVEGLEYEIDSRMVLIWNVIEKLLDEVERYRCLRIEDLWLRIIQGDDEDEDLWLIIQGDDEDEDLWLWVDGDEVWLRGQQMLYCGFLNPTDWLSTSDCKERKNLRSLGEGQMKYANAKEIIAYNEDISLHNTKCKFTIPLLGKRIQHPKMPGFAAYGVDLWRGNVEAFRLLLTTLYVTSAVKSSVLSAMHLTPFLTIIFEQIRMSGAALQRLKSLLVWTLRSSSNYKRSSVSEGVAREPGILGTYIISRWR
ncbi:hypothetical protein EDD15DRAFT_2198460 [Pisolithus albus]|nr:hypothetical protein EDD15DRAFT_2198460 [Pisolithus albus]